MFVSTITAPRVHPNVKLGKVLVPMHPSKGLAPAHRRQGLREAEVAGSAGEISKGGAQGASLEDKQ